MNPTPEQAFRTIVPIVHAFKATHDEHVIWDQCLGTLDREMRRAQELALEVEELKKRIVELESGAATLHAVKENGKMQ